MNEYERKVIDHAVSIMRKNFRRGATLNSPQLTMDLLRVRLTGEKSEVFGVIFLDNRHRVIAIEELFHGTIDGASVHPRVVVQKALEHNCAAVIFYHNHPSGVAEPSAADTRITQRLKDSLSLIEVRTLDHMIVSDVECTSFAERGIV